MSNQAPSSWALPRTQSGAQPQPQARPPTDRARLSRMVRDHFDATWRLLRRLGVRDGDVDDAAQRVFLTASRKLGEIQTGKDRAFLLAVATREASHVRRSYKRRAEVAQEAIGDKSTGRPRPDELAGHKQALDHVRAVLDTLDENLRTVFVLFEVEEMSSEQIAEVLEIPVGTAKSRLRRARARFAERSQQLRALNGEALGARHE